MGAVEEGVGVAVGVVVGTGGVVAGFFENENFFLGATASRSCAM